jgi:hypothetical protein
MHFSLQQVSWTGGPPVVFADCATSWAMRILYTAVADALGAIIGGLYYGPIGAVATAILESSIVGRYLILEAAKCLLTGDPPPMW